MTLLEEMRIRGVYRDNSQEYILRLMEMTPTAANVTKYADIVRDKALLRRLLETADDISATVYAGEGEADAILEAAEQKVFALRRGRTVGGLQVCPWRCRTSTPPSPLPLQAKRPSRGSPQGLWIWGPADPGPQQGRPDPHCIPARYGQDQVLP